MQPDSHNLSTQALRPNLLGVITDLLNAFGLSGKAAIERPVTHAVTHERSASLLLRLRKAWSEPVELQGLEPWASSMPWKINQL